MAVTHTKTATGSDGAHAGRAQPSDWNAAHKVTGSKGDILSFSAADTLANLTVGSDYAVLQADSGEASGMKWGHTPTAFTPAFSFATVGDLAVVYATQEAYWTRENDVVHVWGYLSASSFAWTTAASNFLMTGLPFTVENTTNDIFMGACNLSGYSMATAADVLIVPQNDTTRCRFWVTRNNQNALTALSTAQVPTGGTPDLRFSFAYIAA